MAHKKHQHDTLAVKIARNIANENPYILADLRAQIATKGICLTLPDKSKNITDYMDLLIEWAPKNATTTCCSPPGESIMIFFKSPNTKNKYINTLISAINQLQQEAHEPSSAITLTGFTNQTPRKCIAPDNLRRPHTQLLSLLDARSMKPYIEAFSDLEVSEGLTSQRVPSVKTKELAPFIKATKQAAEQLQIFPNVADLKEKLRDCCGLLRAVLEVDQQVYTKAAAQQPDEFIATKFTAANSWMTRVINELQKTETRLDTELLEQENREWGRG